MAKKKTFFNMMFFEGEKVKNSLFWLGGLWRMELLEIKLCEFIGSVCDHAGCDRPPGHNLNTCWMISRFTTFLPKGQDIDEWYLWVGGGCSEGGLGVFRGRVWGVVRGVFWKWAVTYPKHRIYAENLMWPPSSFHSFWDLPWTLQGRPWDSFYQFLG